MASENKTTRLQIPYPLERDETWWDVESRHPGGRMDVLDKLLYALFENPNIHYDFGNSAGRWDYDRVDSFDVTGGDVVITSPAGGQITFPDGTTIPISSGEYLYTTIPERPLVGTSHTGVLAVASSYLEDGDKLMIGFVFSGKFFWLNGKMRG